MSHSQSSPDSSPAVDTSQLFTEFQPLPRAEWEAKIKKDLKLGDDPAVADAAFQRKTTWRTAEGFNVRPFYDGADLAGLALPENEAGRFAFSPSRAADSNAWEIREEVFDQLPADANARAKTALEAGVNAVSIVIDVEQGQRRGVDLNAGGKSAAAGMQQLLDGIWLDAAPVHFRCGAAAPAVLGLLKQELVRQNIDPAKFSGTVDFDPCSVLAREGSLDSTATFASAASLVSYTQQHLSAVRPLVVSDRVVHEAGAGIVEGLAVALAAGAETLAGVVAAGGGQLDAAAVCRALSFEATISSNYFMEIARLRALRLLWARIAEAFGVTERADRATYIHGRTSVWNLTIYDPHVNMLRATTEAMSAAIGACDACTVLPFDLPLDPATANEFSARISRNIQQVLKHEAYLDKVIDPAAGSYYLENLSDQIARDAWAFFQEIEAAGGYFQSMQSGLIQKRVRATGEAMRAAIASRKRTVLGTNQYPNGAEVMREEIKSPAARPLPAAAALSDADAVNPEALAGQAGAASLSFDSMTAALTERMLGKSSASSIAAEPLAAFRAAEDFEALRLQTENFVAGGGMRPRVFILSYGDLAMRKARSIFTANFFNCAGYEIVDNPGFASPAEGAAAAAKAGAPVVVLCSSDAEYGGDGVSEAIAQLKPAHVVVAGSPADPDVKAALEQAGVRRFIHARSNVLGELRSLQQELGI